jgi:hypothetical protein
MTSELAESCLYVSGVLRKVVLVKYRRMPRSLSNNVSRLRAEWGAFVTSLCRHRLVTGVAGFAVYFQTVFNFAFLTFLCVL